MDDEKITYSDWSFTNEIEIDYVFVDEESFNKYKLKNFKTLMSGFQDYKDQPLPKDSR
jgi:hypothetical protein